MNACHTELQGMDAVLLFVQCIFQAHWLSVGSNHPQL